VAVKLPSPGDKVEAPAAAGSRSRDTSNGSTARAAFGTFMTHSFQPLNSVGGLTAKRR
jgi:hypothetical protein